LPIGSAAAAVADRDVEKTIRPEGHLPPFVIGERLIYGQQNSLAGGVGQVGVGGYLIFGDHRLYLPTRKAIIVQVEMLILSVVGMECQSQQALLAAIEIHFAGDIQKSSWQQRSAADEPYGSRLLNDKFAPAIVIGSFEIERAAKATDKRCKADGSGASRGRRCRG
jgi:hypothetical protein